MKVPQQQGVFGNPLNRQDEIIRQFKSVPQTTPPLIKVGCILVIDVIRCFFVLAVRDVHTELLLKRDKCVSQFHGINLAGC